MIARAGTGKPWLYQSILEAEEIVADWDRQKALFLQHLQGLASLESEHKAVLQSKSLVRYYFRNQFDAEQLQAFYKLKTLKEIEKKLEVK